MPREAFSSLGAIALRDAFRSLERWKLSEPSGGWYLSALARNRFSGGPEEDCLKSGCRGNEKQRDRPRVEAGMKERKKELRARRRANATPMQRNKKYLRYWLYLMLEHLSAFRGFEGPRRATRQPSNGHRGTAVRRDPAVEASNRKRSFGAPRDGGLCDGIKYSQSAFNIIRAV